MNLDEALSRLDDSYELIYVDYRDELSEQQISALCRGDYESLYGLTSEFEIEAQWSGIEYVLNDTFTEGELDELDEDELDELRQAIGERDTSDWLRQLVRQSSSPLFRVNCISEDDAFSFEPVEPDQVLDLLGLDKSEHNCKVIGETLNEASPEYSVIMGYYVFSLDLETIYDAKEDYRIRIANPHLYLGNPFAGSGFLSEEPLEGFTTLNRQDLTTDTGAFGYSLDEIYGGLSASDFQSETELIPQGPDAYAKTRNES